MNRCAVAGCERIPEPGWSRCRAHVEEWLDRVLLPETRAATKAQGYELPRYVAPQAPRTAQEPIGEPDLRDWAPGEILEAYGR